MKTLTKNAFAVSLLTGVLALGCSSSGSGDDGGDDAAPTPFALSSGDSCFDVVSVQPGSNDGCMIGVADVVGIGVLVNYDPSTAILTVGSNGALGGGQIAFNAGTLIRDSMATDPTMTSCTWHQTDTGNVTVTATNEFDLSVTEVEDTFVTACMMTPSTCTSTWTWHMKKGTKLPPGC
jgi:hypothetical protein